MTKNIVGNEIYDLGIAQAEIDYRRERFSETLCSWAWTTLEAVLFIIGYILLMILAFVLCGAANV